MPLDSSFQLSFELTKLFGVARQAASATQAIVTLAKQLRNSGSDIIVEEDLADVFGRMRIEHSIETEFKKRILVDTAIVPLYQQCEIQLQSGPGPTVQRAFRDLDRRYLSTVVQLSMLASMHDRTELASAISENLNKRSAMGLPGATFSPGFEGISKTLEACASQTSAFSWYGYMQTVNNRLWDVLRIPRDNQTFLYNTGILRQDILLAAMDYLCLVQSLPEDRKMVVHVISGCIPLIVWAHYVLGLSVQVISKGKELCFGQGDPQVIIHPGSKYEFSKAEKSTHNAVSLLDSKTQVVLAQVPQTTMGIPLRSQERHILRGIGTENMRRYFYSGLFVIESSQVLYTETAQLVVALSIYKSATLHRVSKTSEPRKSPPCLVDLEQWRVQDAAEIIFDGIVLDNREIAAYVRRLAAFKREDLTLEDVSLPISLNAVIDSANVDEVAREMNVVREGIEVLVASLTALLLVLSHVKEIRNCVDLPILLDFGSLVSRFPFGFHELFRGGAIPLEESTVFYNLASLLIGPTFKPENHEGCFLVSEWGWSVFLSCCDDCDPATVRPELIAVQKGVPTDAKTQERKLRMADFIPPGLMTDEIKVLDRDADYLPRCADPILTRTEYFASRADTFLLDIRLTWSNVNSDLQVARVSYRNLHASLWEVFSTSRGIRCRHQQDTQKRAKLNLGVVASSGYGWATESEGTSPHSKGIPERICISLVAGDQRARWLVTQNAAKSKERQAMLRHSDCCPDCALDTLAKLEGKWVLIL